MIPNLKLVEAMDSIPENYAEKILQLQREIEQYEMVRNDLNIWRGGQPETFADFEHLKSIGVTQIIKLNSESAEDEQDHCNALGIAFFYCPITTMEQILTEPDLQSIRDAVGFIAPGTFIHCEHGQDRTGLVVALWRISQGWSVEQARDEMLANGYHPILVGLEKAWEDMTKKEDK